MPKIGLTLTEAQLRNLTLGLVTKEIQPLIMSVLNASVDLQAQNAQLLDEIRALEARVQRLEMDVFGYDRDGLN